MAERATLSEILNVGVEVTPGTGVSSDKRMSATMLDVGPSVDIAQYRPSGYQFPTVAALNREWVEGTLRGPLTYTEIIYWLASAIDYAAPTGPGAQSEYTWLFEPDDDALDAPKTYTIESGSSVRAIEFTYGLLTGITMRFNRSECVFEAPLIGQALTDGTTLTSTPTAIALIPITVPQVDIKIADTQAGLAGATALARDFSVEWSLSDRWGPVWPLNAATDFAAHVQIEPTLECRLLVAADAEGMALLTNMRANTHKFMRITATGPLIGGAVNYSMQIDSALKVTDVSEFQDHEGVYAIEWTMNGFYDATWAKTFSISVINLLSAL